MESQFGIRNLLADHPVVPVVNITNVNDVEDILKKLMDQGIHCIEITLRSEVAMQALAKALQIRSAGFLVGVGTIVTPDQINDCKALGVDFMVSPGLTSDLGDAFDEAGVPFLPGVMTSSELAYALGRGYDTLKLFPYNIAGGTQALKAYGSVFPQVKFCPTGGVTAETYEAILALDNVICVGGSWVVN